MGRGFFNITMLGQYYAGSGCSVQGITCYLNTFIFHYNSAV